MVHHLYEYMHVAAATHFLLAGLAGLLEYGRLRERVVLSYGAMCLCSAGYSGYVVVVWNLPKVGAFWIPLTSAGLATTFGAIFFYLLTMQLFLGVKGWGFRVPLVLQGGIAVFALADLLLYAVVRRSMMFVPIPRDTVSAHQWMVGEGAYSLLPMADVVAGIFGLSLLFGVGYLIVHLVRRRSRDVLVYAGLFVTAAIVLNETLVAMGVFAGVYLMAFSKAFETVRIYRDIRRRVNEKVARRLRQAEKLEAIGRVASGLAHDFNNVLMVVGNSVELAQDDIRAGTSPEAMLQSALEGVETGTRMASQIRDLARGEARASEPIDVQDFLEGSARLLSRMVGSEVRFEVEIEPEVGVIHMPQGELTQVLMNLVVNANDAMPSGGVLRIEATRVQAPLAHSRRAPQVPCVRISVSDEGCGIPRGVLGHVFEPFFTTKGDQGSGMGLATTHAIIHRVGGRLEVESEEGRGTRFDIYLPCVDVL